MLSDLLESLKQAQVRSEQHWSVYLEIARFPVPSELHALIPQKDRYPNTFLLNTGSLELDIAWLSLISDNSSICE